MYHSKAMNTPHQFFLSLPNQSAEKAGVAFVKGANERNKFFEKINNQ